MRLTAIRALIIALIVLEIGKVPGYNISIWIYLLLFLLDAFYIWMRHVIKIWGLINDYSLMLYTAMLERKRKAATKKAMQDLNNDILN